MEKAASSLRAPLHSSLWQEQTFTSSSISHPTDTWYWLDEDFLHCRTITEKYNTCIWSIMNIEDGVDSYKHIIEIVNTTETDVDNVVVCCSYVIKTYNILLHLFYKNITCEYTNSLTHTASLVLSGAIYWCLSRTVTNLHI